MIPYLAANFSLAVNPSPPITMYMRLLNRPASIFVSNHVLAMNPAAHKQNDKNVMVRLLLTAPVSSLNILLNAFIITSRKIIQLLTCQCTFASIWLECFLQSRVVENSIPQMHLRKSKIMFLTRYVLKLMVDRHRELFSFLTLLLQVRFQTRLRQSHLLMPQTRLLLLALVNQNRPRNRILLLQVR